MTIFTVNNYYLTLIKILTVHEIYLPLLISH